MTRRRPPNITPDEAPLVEPVLPKKRLRLTPEVRRQQILNAALIEFGALGFTAASISKIARRAGTSKANLYVHFSSKDDIFETLLMDQLVPANNSWGTARPDQSIDEQIDAFVDKIYGDLTPTTISMIRLLIAESHRVPDLIQRWYKEVLAPARVTLQKDIDRDVAAGTVRASPLTEYFAFVTVPLLHVTVTKIVFQQEVADSEFEKIKETHRKMLHYLLKPHSDDDTPSCKRPQKKA